MDMKWVKENILFNYTLRKIVFAIMFIVVFGCGYVAIGLSYQTPAPKSTGIFSSIAVIGILVTIYKMGEGYFSVKPPTCR